MIIGLLAASVAAIVVLLFIEKKTTSSFVPTPSPTPSSTGLTPTQQPTPTPSPTPSSLPPSTLTPASNVFSYLNGLLQVSVKYQYPTYIGYKTQLPNGNQLLLLPAPPGFSQSGIACATVLDYNLLPYLIAATMAPSGGPYCEGLARAYAIYNGFIVFDLPPPGATVAYAINASTLMPDVFAIAIPTNNGSIAYVTQDITKNEG